MAETAYNTLRWEASTTEIRKVPKPARSYENILWNPDRLCTRFFGDPKIYQDINFPEKDGESCSTPFSSAEPKKAEYPNKWTGPQCAGSSM